MLRPSRLLSLPLLAALTACPEGPPVQSAIDLQSPDEPGAVPAETAPPPEEGPPSELAKAMHERFAIVGRIQQATVRGDLTRAQAVGAELSATLEADAPPDAWQASIDAMQGELEALEHADDLRSAGAAVARLGLGCGQCHRTLGVTPSLPELSPPEEAKDFEGAMRGHRWAADRMWEGLVGPSSDRWIRGSTIFTVLPGCDETMGDTKVRLEHCQRAQSLARRGHVARSLEARATIYGRLLTTCAECHTAASAP